VRSSRIQNSRRRTASSRMRSCSAWSTSTWSRIRRCSRKPCRLRGRALS
jgi:hypothetical protein